MQLFGSQLEKADYFFFGAENRVNEVKQCANDFSLTVAPSGMICA